MADVTLILNAAERDCLVNLLENVLKEVRVEEHRTRSPAYRQDILAREHLIESALAKLKKPG